MIDGGTLWSEMLEFPEKLVKSFLFVHFLWLSPLILISYTYMLWQEIGVSSLAGFGALVILVPIQGYFSRMMGKCR
uniref:Uncharacterized protein n=1 Tax=Parascaris equorum TaxID=6256 RepID=A0A914SJF1_PAREQ